MTGSPVNLLIELRNETTRPLASQKVREFMRPLLGIPDTNHHVWTWARSVINVPPNARRLTRLEGLKILAMGYMVPETFRALTPATPDAVWMPLLAKYLGGRSQATPDGDPATAMANALRFFRACSALPGAPVGANTTSVTAVARICQYLSDQTGRVIEKPALYKAFRAVNLEFSVRSVYTLAELDLVAQGLMCEPGKKPPKPRTRIKHTFAPEPQEESETSNDAANLVYTWQSVRAVLVARYPSFVWGGTHPTPEAKVIRKMFDGGATMEAIEETLRHLA